jgi:hypothetical protein
LYEGYTPNYTYDGADRQVYWNKPERWIWRSEIVEAFHDSDAAQMVGFYQRFKRMGMPYGAWGDNPNRLVEIVDILEPLDRLYNPRLI